MGHRFRRSPYGRKSKAERKFAHRGHQLRWVSCGNVAKEDLPADQTADRSTGALDGASHPPLPSPKGAFVECDASPRSPTSQRRQRQGRSSRAVRQSNQRIGPRRSWSPIAAHWFRVSPRPRATDSVLRTSMPSTGCSWPLVVAARTRRTGGRPRVFVDRRLIDASPHFVITTLPST